VGLLLGSAYAVTGDGAAHNFRHGAELQLHPLSWRPVSPGVYLQGGLHQRYEPDVQDEVVLGLYAAAGALAEIELLPRLALTLRGGPFVVIDDENLGGEAVLGVSFY
jgi:hypothetical protein